MKQLTKIITIFIFSNFLFFSSPQTGMAAVFDMTKLKKTAGTEGAGYTTSNADPSAIIGAVVGAVLNFLGVIFLILMIYGGIMWMTAAGNDEQIGKARKIITAAIIGLIIVVSAYAITAFIGTRVINPMI